MSSTSPLRWRGLSNIPRDQQKLLSSSASWAVDFGHGPHAFVNVPSHVLETTKQAFKAKNRVNSGTESPTATPKVSLQDGISPRPRESHILELPPEQHTGTAEQTITGPEPSCPVPSLTSPEKPICSSPDSPDRELPPLRDLQAAHIGSSIVHETPKSIKTTPRFQQSQPKANSLRDGSDVDDLEMLLPQAEADIEAPINRVAARPISEAIAEAIAEATSTPIVEPTDRTVSPTVKSTASAYGGRKHRHKLITWDLVASRKSTASTGPNRMPTTKNLVDDALSSDASSSSSISPRLGARHGVMASVETSAPPPAQKPALQTSRAMTETSPSSVVAETKGVSQHLVQKAAPMALDMGTTTASPPPPTCTTPSVLLQSQPSASIWDSGHVKPPQTPCEAFLAAYPDYVISHGGSLQNFVRACVCLLYLREKRLLRDYLFDDFVRFFSAEYLAYVARAGPGREALPAIERFNMQRGAPLYNRMVLSGKDLDAVFEAYPEDTMAARSLVAADDAESATDEEPANIEETRLRKPALRRTVDFLPQRYAFRRESSGLETTTDVKSSPRSLRRIRSLQSSPLASRPSLELGSEFIPSSTLPALSKSAALRPQQRKELAMARSNGSKRKRQRDDEAEYLRNAARSFRKSSN
ncbi:hypothetical protein GQ602_001039 [Ophiocordyceps camponoti-floridani]|uniref:Uncharacterized protein n=1 Tax=Ophiocordyceps camponoti-floridani TaxID=2030778 RepID=A0A8H4VH18_9HYPO|nr:hypothetical protein GQ602_001039 [Ophiocordyceps camponoti-floridani]